MTQEEIREGNRAIMFFDGALNVTIPIMGELQKAIKYKDSYYPKWNIPNFHLDWNLLMPVVEKINNLGGYEVHISPHTITIKGEKAPIAKTDIYDLFTIVGLNYSLIEATWNTVVQFIKWYNQQSH